MRHLNGYLRGMIAIFLVMSCGMAGLIVYRHQHVVVSQRATHHIYVDQSEIVVDDHSPAAEKIVTAPAHLAPKLHFAEVPAFVSPDERKTVEIFLPVTGRIIETDLRVGQPVTKGQTLAVIESGDYNQAVADYQTAIAQETYQERVVSRARDVLRIGGNAAKDLDAAINALAQAQAERQRAEKRLEVLNIGQDQAKSGQVKIFSPLNGYVQRTILANAKNITDITVSQATLEDLSEVQIEAYLPEDAAPFLKIGLGMHVSFDALPGKRCDGVIERIDPELRDEIRRIVARMTCSNADSVLRPNMFAHAAIDVPMPDTVLIPDSAVVMDNDQLIVFVQTSEGHFTRRVIKAGFDEGDDVRVTEGLKSGDIIVTKGAILLNDAL